MMYINVSEFIGIIIACCAVVAILFAAIGYYAALKDEEHRQQKVLDTVVMKAHQRPDPKSIAIGVAYQQFTHPPTQ